MTACQSRGYSRVLSDSLGTMPGTYSLLGNMIVLGDAMPSLLTRAAPKNLSSAVHMNGLLMTVLPSSTAFLRYERYIGTSCEMRSTSTSYGTGSSCASAPIFAYSQTTPWSREFTSLMSSGGIDHSRPTNNPIFFMGNSSRHRDQMLSPRMNADALRIKAETAL